jgi:hypothetical protein
MGTASTSIHKEGKQARTFVLDRVDGVMNYASLVLYITLLS